MYLSTLDRVQQSQDMLDWVTMPNSSWTIAIPLLAATLPASLQVGQLQSGQSNI